MSTSEVHGRLRIRTLLMVSAGCVLAALLVVIGVAVHISSLMPTLFKLNKKCQEEGYFMAEFEFKMLGFGYQLDKGQYLKAYSGIRRLHEQLKSRKGLIKVPKFSNKREELEFYLALQNPRTGAFMDDSFPYCTYNSPTQNVLAHLERLAKAAGQPLRLKYRLKYLDEVNTPQKLTAFLDDVSTIGWLASKFPQNSFHFAREFFEYSRDGWILERNNLYTFPEDWKQAMRQWFYDFQDAETGLWGAKSRSGKLWFLDVHNTCSIVKGFVDADGNDRYPSFPLRHKPEMFAATLKVMSQPPPAEGDLHEWHEWSLSMGKSVDLLTRYLWKDASEEHRSAAASVFAEYTRIKFDRYFVPSEGAFSYYPGSQHATLDGTNSGVGDLFEVGAVSPKRQERLWGGPRKTCTDLGRLTLAELAPRDIAPILDLRNVNSIRVFAREPDAATNYTTGAAGVFYPRPTSVLDIVELVPRLRKWLETTSQSMGNWVSREEALEMLSKTGIEPVPVSREQMPLAQWNRILKENKTLILIGVDVLQVPRGRLTLQVE